MKIGNSALIIRRQCSADSKDTNGAELYNAFYYNSVDKHHAKKKTGGNLWHWGECWSKNFNRKC